MGLTDTLLQYYLAFSSYCSLADEVQFIRIVVFFLIYFFIQQVLISYLFYTY